MLMMFLLQGAGVLSSSVVQGMVFKKTIDGDVTKIEKGKIAVYSCPVDSSSTETKVRTLLLTRAESRTNKLAGCAINVPA